MTILKNIFLNQQDAMQPKDQLPGKSLLRDAVLSAQLDPKESFWKHQEKQSGSKDRRELDRTRECEMQWPTFLREVVEILFGVFRSFKARENQSTTLFSYCFEIKNKLGILTKRKWEGVLVWGKKCTSYHHSV